jgi:hypothetical protein
MQRQSRDLACLHNQAFQVFFAFSTKRTRSSVFMGRPDVKKRFGAECKATSMRIPFLVFYEYPKAFVNMHSLKGIIMSAESYALSSNST